MNQKQKMLNVPAGDLIARHTPATGQGYAVYTSGDRLPVNPGYQSKLAALRGAAR